MNTCKKTNQTENSNMRERLNKERLTDEEIDLLYDIMEITGNIFDRFKIRYTLEGGSLLGAVRNGGIIPHDNDGDFDILESDIEKIKSLKNEFDKYDLVIIETPGWGLQISHKNSPDLEPNMWTDNQGNYWTSKWPFLDLIAIKYDTKIDKYVLSQDVAKQDYPDYYLTPNDWQNDFEKIKFGHLQLWAIAGHQNRINYLNRHYGNWQNEIIMVMDHRKNIYFDEPIKLQILDADLVYRKHSKRDL
jgi:lipopolysaccharide cholinephosphotransferase